MSTAEQHPLRKILQNRIAIIDGAMGTTIRTYGMKEADIRAERFKNSTKDLLNNGDLFSLTQPKMICDIHRRFLEAGADIIETNTFGATSIAQSEFFVEDPRERGGRKDPEFYQKIIDDQFLGTLAWDINEQSARRRLGRSPSLFQIRPMPMTQVSAWSRSIRSRPLTCNKWARSLPEA